LWLPLSSFLYLILISSFLRERVSQPFPWERATHDDSIDAWIGLSTICFRL
jgi:hypothetical protein